MSVAAILSGVTVCLIPFVASLWLVIVVMTHALSFVSTMTAAAWAMPGDIVDTTQVASLGAIQNFGGYFGGAFSPLVAGVIVDRSGSYSLAFISGGIIAALAAVVYTVLVREPLKNEPSAPEVAS